MMRESGRAFLTLVILATMSIAGFLPSNLVTYATEPARTLAALSSVGPTVAVPGTTPAVSFPAYYRDANGVALSLCLDGLPKCLASAADLNPGNLAATGEAFWWEANVSSMPVGTGTATLVLALEAAFGTSNGKPQAGAEMSFGRIRIRASGLTPGTYVVTHPFGEQTFVVTSGDGRSINSTTDIGCVPVLGVSTCDFSIALSSGIGPFLVWDPAVAPAAPAGYVGDGVTPHKVIGSPTGNNFFRVTGPDGTFTSDQFIVQGKLAVDAINDAVSVPAGANNVPIDVLSNDLTGLVDTLSVSAVTQPANGTSAVAAGNTHATYTNNGTAGTDAFTYTATAVTAALTDTATVTLTVHVGNTAPVATNDAATVPITSTGTAITVLANDTDAEGDLTFVSAVTQGAKGTVSVGTTGRNVVYVPNGTPGPDSFTYTVSDGVGTSIGTVNVTVNRAPSAANDTATVSANTNNNIINVLANDTDPDANPLTVTAVTQSISGTVSLGPSGAHVLYSPNPNFGGTDSFTYTVSDGSLTSQATVSVTVNRPPVGVTDVLKVAVNSADNAIDVLSNDSDPDGNPITISAVTQPANGLVAIGPAAANVVYTPNAGFFGADPFTYTISDGLLTATTTVSLSVNRPPVAVSDTARAPRNSITNTISTLANDSDPDGNTITVVAVTQAANGTTAVGSGGADVSYVPNTGFVGTDSFTYTISDGHLTATNAVTVSVHRAPAVLDDSFRIAQDSLDSVLDVLANDRDPDGDPITVVSATQGAGGIVALGTGGANLVYTPRPGFAGVDSFTYTVSDGQLEETATVTVLVNRAPLPLNDFVAVSRNSLGNPINVLANDSDPDGNTLTVSEVTQGASGAAVSIGPAGLSVVYSPSPGFAGVDTFTYTISDGLQTASATVSVTIPDQRVSNSSPVAVNDSVAVARNSSNNVINVLANDSDPDGDSVRIISLGQPSIGTAVIGGGGSIIVYTPNAGFSGNDSFIYVISDGLLSSGGTVVVNVPNNSAPSAVNDSLSVPSNSSNNPLPVLGNDTDPDGDLLRVTAVSPAANGAVGVGLGGATVTYTPNPGFAGTDNFTYSITDGAQESTGNVEVIVHAQNNAPVALDDAVTVAMDSGTNVIQVLSNDMDPDGDPVAVASFSQGAGGAVSVAPDRRSILYTPRAGFAGEDTFDYAVIDGSLGSAPATVTVSVRGVKVYFPAIPHMNITAW